MKKTYSTPILKVYDMKCESVIAASVGVSATEVDAQSALSNEKDMWGNSNDFWK